MNNRRLYIPVVLMLLAIVAVLAFQLYWLNKNYREEKSLLNLRTNILFREAINQCQIEKIKLDSSLNNVNIMVGARKDAVSMVNNLRKKIITDSIKLGAAKNSATIIALKTDEVYSPNIDEKLLHRTDSVKKTFNFVSRAGNKGWIQVLQGVDSLQDTLTLKEVSDKYAALLKQEKLKLDFSVSRKNATAGDELFPPDFERSNQVTVGFFRPVTFTLQLQNTSSYLLKRMAMPLLVSVLLVGLTVFSFVLLLRNLIQQRKLTQIKNEFISNITHELKTPIATVSVAIEALKNFNALDDPSRTKEYLDISGNELQRLSLLVDKVLKLSMFEKQQIDLRQDSFDLKQLVEEVVNSMRLQFEKSRAQVSIETSGDNFTIDADRLHITSVIFNLLDNALKYSKANPAIRIELKEEAGKIMMSVVDNGIGISPEYKKKIFEKFFRVPSGDTHNVKGYGLGLSYVAYVVAQHKGTIDIESQPGIGSRFVVVLPKGGGR